MLKSYKTLLNSTIAVAALAAALAACGGGGGGGGNTIPSPTQNPTGSPTTAPTTTPTTAPASATGQLTVLGAAMSNAKVVFTCGCSPQAGTVTADANGNYTLPPSVTAVPASPSPTYTAVPGRNYLVVGASTTTKAESWTMLFYGSTPAHNVYLTTGNVSDEFTAAASLYVYYNSQNASDQSFDGWNFNSIASFANELRTTTNPKEQQLINDIKTAQQNNVSLFPSPNGSVPAWDPHGMPANPTIKADITALSGDSAAPTPCPGGQSGCTGTPSP
ncbi:MAG: hypothetical protein JO165_00820 [Candidatus Eremiobacteraeota bacterium]|nr:hypothetical protein [Candidatus Eremiobacteraeota bacterium]